MTTHFKEIPCPKCGHKIDGATTLYKEDAIPVKGDVSLCINCGETLVFADDHGTLAVARARDLMDLAPTDLDLLSRGRKFIKMRGMIR